MDERVQKWLDKDRANLSLAAQGQAHNAIGEVVVHLHSTGATLDKSAIVTELLRRAEHPNALLREKFAHAAQLLAQAPSAPT